MSAVCDAHRYSLEEFKQLDSPLLRVLPADIMETLRLIETQIIIPTDDEKRAPLVAAPLSSSRGGANPRRHHHHHHATGSKPHRSSSNNDTAFHATKRTEIVGVDKQFNDIRAMINKLSSKNFETQKPVVLDNIAKFLFDIDGNIDFIKKIVEMLTSNKFLVNIYVEIYADLCLPEFTYSDLFQNLLHRDLCEEYIASLKDLQAVVESSGDYDAFCEYNKRNDNRKAKAVFLAEATKRGVFPARQLGVMIDELLQLILAGMDLDGRSHEIEEMTENVALLVAGHTNANIRQCIVDLSLKKVKEHPSWSSRALFKYMDLAKIYSTSSL